MPITLIIDEADTEYANNLMPSGLEVSSVKFDWQGCHLVFNDDDEQLVEAYSATLTRNHVSIKEPMQ